MPGQDGLQRVILGRIGAPHGLRGWVKVYSYTYPVDNILRYPEWQVGCRDGWRAYRPCDGNLHGRGLTVRLAPVDGEGGASDREAAARLRGAEVAVWRSEMEAPAPGEYYWVDLIGLRVCTVTGEDLGLVQRIFETGANDVLVVRGERERLIPFLREQVIREVDVEAGFICVDWDPDF